jgi:hypothetical protein
MNVRWKEHVSAAKAGVGCPVLGAAIRKYGEHAFKHEVLDVVTTQRGADIAERVWIEARGTRVPGGYNLEAGGNGHGRVHEITKRRIGEKSKARLAAMTPEQRTAFLRTNILKWTPERRKAQSERTPSVEKAHEAVRKIFAGLTIEERSARVKRMLSGMTQEQLGDRVRKAWANLTPEARAERVRNAQAAGIIAGPRRSKKMSEFQTARQKTLTPEQRSENTRKAWATRRANAAARATASIVDKKK